MLHFARQQALQAMTTEQLLRMIHTMLAAILAALLQTWRRQPVPFRRSGLGKPRRPPTYTPPC